VSGRAFVRRAACKFEAIRSYTLRAICGVDSIAVMIAVLLELTAGFWSRALFA
jgi:hypothetical protein